MCEVVAHLHFVEAGARREELLDGFDSARETVCITPRGMLGTHLLLPAIAELGDDLADGRGGLLKLVEEFFVVSEQVGEPG